MGSVLVALNGRELWVYVVEVDEGVKARFALDEWESLGLHEGRRVPVRLPGKDDAWFFVTAVAVLPPVAWVTMVERVRVTG